MDLEKIELLVKKIDQAIKTIKHLKSENNQKTEQIEEFQKFQKENEKSLEENQKLKDENKALKNEINEITTLHEKLEDKIQEILQYLPDDNDDNNVEKKEDTVVIIDSQTQESKKHEKNDEKDEERLKKFVDKPNDFEKKSLFSDDHEQKNDEAQTTIPIASNFTDEKNDIDQNNKGGVDIKFEETLISKDDENEIDFHFDNNDTNNDLPKGVL